MILAVVLSALVLLGWTWAANKFFPTANPPPAKVENGKAEPAQQAGAQPVPQPGAQPVPSAPKTLQTRAQVLSATPRVQIRTPSLVGSINLKGAQIDDLLLVRHRLTIDRLAM